MPYSTNADLPAAIQEHLPTHAQDIFRKAFNNALAEYNDEITAVKVAWAAVKRQYQKDVHNRWVKK